MMKVNSRQPESTMQNSTEPDGNRTTYEPIRISNEVVEEMAGLLYTQEAIAKRFKITRDTLMALYGEAFHRGQESLVKLAKSERRRAIHDLKRWREAIDPMTDRQNSWSDKDAPFDKLERILDKAEARLEPKDVEDVAPPSLSIMSDEDLDNALLAVALERGWTPPKASP